MSRHADRLRTLASLLAALAAVLVLAACGDDDDATGTPAAASGGSETSAPLKVGILKIAPASVIDDTLKAYQDELRATLAPREVQFDVKDAQGDESLIQSISREFSRSDRDLFAVIGTPAVIAMAKLEKRRPVIAIAMGDPVGAKVAESLDAPGGNVTGSIDYVDPAQLLDLIAKTSPAPKRIGTIFDPSNQNSQIWSAALRKAAASRGVTVHEATIASSKDVNTAARALRDRCDALLIGPDATVVSSLPAVASVTRANKIPLYLSGGDVSTTGVLASLGPDYPTIGRATAAVTAKVVAGTSPGSVAFARPAALSPAVNATTLKSLDVTLPAEMTGGQG